MTQDHCKFCIGRIPASFESTYSLDFKVEYYPHSLLESDGLIVPQSSSAECYLWNRDTAQFHPVEFDDRICIDRPGYSPDGRLFACWSDTDSCSSLGHADWPSRWQVPDVLGGYHWPLNLNYSPTLIKHSPGDELIALWHHSGNTIGLFDIYTGCLYA